MVSRGVLPIGRRPGGAELAAFELAKHLALQEHEVTLVADVEHPLSALVLPGMSVRRITNGGYLGKLLRLIPVAFPRWLCQHFVGNVRAGRRAAVALAEANGSFEIVHSHGALATIVIGRAIRRGGWRVTLVYTEHDSTPWTCVPRGLPERVVRKVIYSTINMKACRYANVVVTSYAELAKELSQRTGLPPDRFEVTPNGADVDRFVPAELLEGRLRPEWERYCLFVGSLTERKAPDLLIQALALAKIDLSLVMVGDGPMGRDLERLAKRLHIADRVIFTGALPQSVVHRLYQAASFLVLPSVSEAAPLVLIEALATGKPVVATELDGVATIVRDGENGLLVPPGDVRGLSSALARLANDGDLYARLAANAAPSVVDRFSWSAVASNVCEIYVSRRLHGVEVPEFPLPVAKFRLSTHPWARPSTEVHTRATPPLLEEDDMHV